MLLTRVGSLSNYPPCNKCVLPLLMEDLHEQKKQHVTRICFLSLSRTFSHHRLSNVLLELNKEQEPEGWPPTRKRIFVSQVRNLQKQHALFCLCAFLCRTSSSRHTALLESMKTFVSVTQVLSSQVGSTV